MYYCVWPVYHEQMLLEATGWLRHQEEAGSIYDVAGEGTDLTVILYISIFCSFYDYYFFYYVIQFVYLVCTVRLSNYHTLENVFYDLQTKLIICTSYNNKTNVLLELQKY